MTKTMRFFIQGLLDHAEAMMPLAAPTPNCYRRTKPHTFAPSNVSWGVEDRTAMVRVKDPGLDSAHIEMRAASGMSNPYLTAAAVLAAGLLGVKAQRELRPQAEGPGEEDPELSKLPGNLEKALAALETDRDMCAMLGEDFVHVFSKVKQFELARYHSHVTDWERNEYMEIY